jgi:hypothetical protein
MSRDVKRILNLLLDRYERSTLYRGTGESPRRIFLRYDRATLPGYWEEAQWERRTELNQATLSLERDGILQVRRSRYSCEEIERVDLVLTRLDQAYLLAGRPPRRTQEIGLADVASTWAERWPHDWRRAFAGRVEEAVESYGRLPAGLKPNEQVLLDEIFRVFDGLGPAGISPEMPRRIFSQQVLGSSKRLEAIQGRLIRALREAWAQPLPTDEKEALAEFGVVENPQHVLVAGPVVLDSLDIGAVGSDLGLSAAFIERCRVTALEADTVLTVENLTSFYQVVSSLPSRMIAIYLGGYHNRIRRRLLLKLAEARPTLRFSHWGDLDLGGFRIFVHLREQTGLDLQPWLMDLQTYVRYQSAGMAFNDRYGKELSSLRNHLAYERFWPVIVEMLKCRRRVEQEAVAFGWEESCTVD